MGRSCGRARLGCARTAIERLYPHLLHQRLDVTTADLAPLSDQQAFQESFQPGETVSSVARRRGVAPNLLYRWRRLMTEGGAAAVGSDEPVVGSSEVRRLEERVRELERMLGRKTMEVEIFREALAKSKSKKPSLRLLSQPKDASR